MEELKPCPFCGGEAEFKPMISNGNHPDDDIGYVRCKSCISETGYNQLRADAIQQWNRRATSENSSELEQLKADNAALKAKYDEINRYNISCTKKIDELLAEKLDTDTHLKAINDSLAEQLRRAAPENKPLTLDELRGMDGKPVWIVINGDGRYGLISGAIGNYVIGVVTPLGDWRMHVEDYGKTWLAYAHRKDS